NVATLAPAWSANLLETASEPIVRGDRVYLTTGGRDAAADVSRIDARAYATATGTLAWDRELFEMCCDTPSISYPPAAFVGGELWTGYLMLGGSIRPTGGYRNPVRLRPADGSVIDGESNVATSAAVTAEGVVVQTRLQVGTVSGRSVAVRDQTTLATRWTAVLSDSLAGGLLIEPAVVDHQVYVADQNVLSAFPVAGCGLPQCPPTWTLDLGTPLSTVAAARGGGDVFVISGTDLVAVARATGTVRWRAPLGALVAPGLALTGDTVFVGAGSGLQAFAAAGCGAATCGPTWTAQLAAGAAATAAPVVAGGVVYAGGDGSVDAFAAGGCGADTCPALTSVSVAGAADHLSVDGGRLFVVTRPAAGATAGKLTAFAPAH
ncbi:MAG TPA: PQQ-binding-like beta-propeller repeat protein, partial [Acidimicrobiales bacterium]|nr:PQQ-binding-like beta-propeller repeat protein [Acidimicrobiales bacterium]